MAFVSSYTDKWPVIVVVLSAFQKAFIPMAHSNKNKAGAVGPD